MRTQYKPSEFVLTHKEIQLMSNNASNIRDSLILESLYYPALRRFEVANLMIEDINFDTGWITIVGKGDKISPIPVASISPAYMTKLKFYIGNKRSGYVFLSNRNKKLSLPQINNIVKNLAENVDLTNRNPIRKNINPHMLRHSRARHLKNMKYPLEFIQKFLRHSSMKTTADEYGTLSIHDMEVLSKRKNAELEQSTTIQEVKK